jgi:hypothetical protein
VACHADGERQAEEYDTHRPDHVLQKCNPHAESESAIAARLVVSAEISREHATFVSSAVNLHLAMFLKNRVRTHHIQCRYHGLDSLTRKSPFA